MRWYEAELHALEEVGCDELGTPVCEPRPAGTVLVRPAPWAARDGGGKGNAYDVVRRTFITKAPPEALAGVAYIDFAHKRYEVEEVSHAPGTVVITASRSKEAPCRSG